VNAVSAAEKKADRKTKIIMIMTACVVSMADENFPFQKCVFMLKNILNSSIIKKSEFEKNTE
jgi:hypothetical protein